MMHVYTRITSGRIKQLGIGSDFTEEQLAYELVCDVEKVKDLEAGKCSPTADDLIRMSRLFDVSTDFLLGVSNDLKGV